MVSKNDNQKVKTDKYDSENERWMLHKAFKRSENRTLLKRFVLRTTAFHQHMAKSTTRYNELLNL